MEKRINIISMISNSLNILNNCIKIAECLDNKNIDELIKYYNEYNIIESVKIEDVKTILLIMLSMLILFSILKMEE